MSVVPETQFCDGILAEGAARAVSLLRGLTCAVILGIFLLLRAEAEAPGVELSPLSVDDVLKIEGFGDARFSPDGRWLAYNQIPPYDQLKDYSYALYAYIQSGHQIRIVDMQDGRTPILHPGFDPDASSFLLGFSPDSRYVVALEYRLGNFRIVACPPEGDTCVRFNALPDILDRYFGSAPWNERLVWTSDTTFVLPLVDEFQPGSELRSRAVAGRFLQKQWDRAWTGSGPTASQVISTGGDRSSEWAEGQLVTFNLEQGVATALAKGRFAGPRLSPDGSQLAAARVSQRLRPEPGASNDPDVTHSPFDRRYHLSLIDLSGAVHAVTAPYSIDPNSIEWSPGGQVLVVYGWEKNEHPADGRLYQIDRQELSSKVYATPGLKLANSRMNEALPLTVGPARLLMFEAGIAVFARPQTGGRYDWYFVKPDGTTRPLTRELSDVSGFPLYADDRNAAILATDGVYRVGTEMEALKLTPGREGTFRSLAYRANPQHSWSYAFRWTSDLHRQDWEHTVPVLLGTGDGKGDSEVIFLNMVETGNSVSPLKIPFAGARVIAESSVTRAAAVTVKDGAATRLLLVRGSGAPIELAHINQHLNQIAHPGTVTISYDLADPEDPAHSRPVTGCLTLPVGYEAGHRYPLVIEAYPVGTPGRCDTLRDAAKPALSLKDIWASRGYIHIRPALPLDMARTEDGPLGGIGSLLEQSASEIIRLGYADPDRLVLYGFSQGGVSALQAATQTSRFGAVISMNGWADYFGHYFGPRGLMRYFHLDQNGGDNRWRYECLEKASDHHCPFGFGETALAAPEAYAAASPLALASDIMAPVMLIHSDLDYFDMSQYDAMFGALYRAGKEAVYVRYWGEGHGPSSPANMRDLWTRIDHFLESAGMTASGASQEELQSRAASGLKPGFEERTTSE